MISGDIMKQAQSHDAHSEIGWSILKLLERNGNGFDICVFLLSKRNICFVEEDSLVLLCVHSHQALHEILLISLLASHCTFAEGSQTHSDLLPIIILHLEGTQVMLKRYNQAMARNQLFRLCAAHVCPFTQGDNGSERLPVILITERTSVESLFGPGKIVDGKLTFHSVRFALALRQPVRIVINVIQVVLSRQKGCMTSETNPLTLNLPSLAMADAISASIFF